MAKQASKKESKKVMYFVVGLAIFVMIGTGLFFVDNGSFPKGSFSKPALNAGYNFNFGVTAKSLDFSSSEVYQLNNCFINNKNLVEKATLVIVGAGTTVIGKNTKIEQNTPLNYKVVLESKGGMKFTPEMRHCSRKKLVGKIVHNFDRGSKVLAAYVNDPAFKGRAVDIKDM